MKPNAQLILLGALASCVTTADDDPTLDDPTDEMSRTAPFGEPTLEPWGPCAPSAPTITAISQTSFERGATPYYGYTYAVGLEVRGT